MLDFAEQIVLLQIESEGGRAAARPTAAAEVIVAGAALMDLALRNRIDADLDRMFVVDATPIGDEILDDVLEQLDRAGTEFTGRTALDSIADHAKAYRQTALQRLVDKGMLRDQGGRLQARQPIAEDGEQRELRARLRQLLLTDDEIPDPADVMLVCLIEAGGLLGLVLTAAEFERARNRTEQVKRLDLIGHAVAWAVAEMSLTGRAGSRVF